MDENTLWKIIVVNKFRRQLPLDIEYCSPISIRAMLLDVRTPAHILDRIAQAYCDDDDVMRDLVHCPNLDETTLAFIALTCSDDIKGFIAGARCMEVVYADDAAGETSEPATKKKKLNVMQQVQRMTVSQKIKLAMSGAKEARGLLIRESSKIIALGVLENPHLTSGEVEFFAKSTNLSEDVIRKIGTNAEWTRKPSIASALVNNPKTPVGISMGFIPRLSVRELGMLETSRNVPEAVRSAARVLLVKKKQGKA